MKLRHGGFCPAITAELRTGRWTQVSSLLGQKNAKSVNGDTGMRHKASRQTGEIARIIGLIVLNNWLNELTFLSADFPGDRGAGKFQLQRGARRPVARRGSRGGR